MRPVLHEGSGGKRVLCRLEGWEQMEKASVDVSSGGRRT